MLSKLDFRLLLALAGVAIIWGTTYLGIRIAVETIPPLFVTGIRQVIASCILLCILMSKGELAWIDKERLKHNFVLSVLTVILANGLTTVAEKSIPSGLTSLLTTLSPIFVFLLGLLFRLEKLSFKSFFGVLLGLSGMVLIFWSSFGDLLDPAYRFGIIVLLIAIISWSLGTIYTKKTIQRSSNIFLDLLYQFVFAGVVQLVLALFISGDTQIANWSSHSMMAVVYLAVFGSIGGFFSYRYALKHISATSVSVLTYLNTIIALFLGWLILDEKITWQIIVAAMLIICGVFVTNYKSNK